MSQSSKIEWTDTTWNPVRGCTRVSEGCRNCYAERMAARFSDPGLWGHGFARWRSRVSGLEYESRSAAGESDPRWTGRVELVPEKLDEPLRWRKPRRVFVNSTSDLFHEKLSDEDIDRVFAAMLLSPQHTFQVLTKRPKRMRQYLTAGTDGLAVDRYLAWLGRATELRPKAKMSGTSEIAASALANVWLGVSVENQAAAEARIPELLATPAALRFVSAEPLLGPLSAEKWLRRTTRHHLGQSVQGALRNRSFDAFQSSDGSPLTRDEARAELEKLDRDGVRQIPVGDCDAFDPQTGCPGHPTPAIDWLIVGGESGPDARGCHLEWVRSLVTQCREAGASVFLKQLGDYLIAPNDEVFTDDELSFPEDGVAQTYLYEQCQGGDCRVRLVTAKGGNPAEWPEDLRRREWPSGARESVPAPQRDSGSA